MYSSIFKNVFDFVIASIGLIVAFPLLLILVLLLAVQNNGSPFFTQFRPGKSEIGFYILKFKTMNDKTDDKGDLLSDKERLTFTGRFIRKASLDELPQLFNVLKGDMSLIGPRPLLFKYLELYDEEQRRRHNVKPGITGWAQVNGRNSISWSKKFKLDIYYVDNYSFFMDLKILILTIKKVLIREGVNQSQDQPMKPFNGLN